MENVVVIGGSGFLGSFTADELSSRGYNVTIFDSNESKWIKDNQEIKLGNILDLEVLKQVFTGIDIVYHFAGISDIKEAADNPYETININVMGTTCILEALRSVGVKRFVFASTMYVYSPYGSYYRASKQAAETIIEAYSEAYDIQYTFLRYGSLYGPRSQDWNGLRRYIKQIIRHGELSYDGSGREKREYIHVQDAARLSVDILDHEHENKAVTVTGTQIMSSGDLLEMIFEISGKAPRIKYIDSDRHDYHYTMTPYRYTPKKARKLTPSEFVDIGQGILEIVEEISREEEALATK